MTHKRARSLVMVGAPEDCYCAPEADADAFGTELAPAALRMAGLADATGAIDDGDLPVRLVGTVRDAGTGVLGWPSVLQLTATVRDKVRDLVGAGSVPLLAGGCCVMVPGALAGARDALGAVGLAYLDGHLDLYDGRTSPTGEAADMPISVITGLGPAAWSVAVGAPLTRPGQLLLLGPRDQDQARADGSAMPGDVGIEPELTPADLRSRGMTEAGAAAERQLSAAGPFWMHLDVDVLDQTEFPATDYLQPGGLTFTELASLMQPLVASPALAGMSIGSYNPDKDPAATSARALVTLLGDCTS
jgi:arginase